MPKEFVGGLIIGLSAMFLLYGNGRVAGISGILGGLLKPTKGEVAWRASFLAGLILGGFVYMGLNPEFAKPIFHLPISSYIIAGLLVGFGTRWGSGCTSGHGVCGMSRFSKRSIVATVTFMLSGMITVFVLYRMGA